MLVDYSSLERLFILRLELHKSALGISQLPGRPLSSGRKGRKHTAGSEHKVFGCGWINALEHEVRELVLLGSYKYPDDLPAITATHSERGHRPQAPALKLPII